jgi:hypothetical protein
MKSIKIHLLIIIQICAGWVHVTDERVLTPKGRIPYPENIFGSAKYTRGKLVPNTFEPNPTHRLVSGDGIFKIPAFYHDYLLKELQKE